jgi:hypothetical protein
MRQRGMKSIATEHSESTQPFNLPKEKLNEIFSLKEKSEVLPSTKLILEQQQQLQQYQSKLDFQEQQLALQQAQLDGTIKRVGLNFVNMSPVFKAVKLISLDSQCSKSYYLM